VPDDRHNVSITKDVKEQATGNVLEIQTQPAYVALAVAFLSLALSFFCYEILFTEK